MSHYNYGIIIGANESAPKLGAYDLLESSHTIKTFFKENDRTPNHDGFFELVGQDGDPKKQFIVQIKKTKALECEPNGKHKGKYIYDLETPFLYYVKAKVAESPAVYFVVDIDNSRVFYLYLSDETLMGLNFEGHQTVRYPFDESNVLVDVNSFYKELDEMRRISLFDSFAWNSIILELRDFRTKHKNDEDFKLHTNAIFRLIGKEGVEYFVAMSELTKRSISSITSVWKYNPTDYLQKRSFLERDFKPICEKWFGHLPSLYQEFYDNVFNGNMKYFFSREIEYCIEDNVDNLLKVVSKARVYSFENRGLNITYQKPISTTYSETDKLRGLLYIQSGELFGASLMNRIPTLFYDGIRCFLYQGVCDTLNLKCNGIRINGRSECLFK